MTETLVAGRELDALVAEKVMGHTVTWLATAISPAQPHYVDRAIACGYLLVEYYSTDIGAAWQVVERMRELNYGIAISDGPAWSFAVAPNDDAGDVTCELADTLPLAICRAALRAVAT